MVEPFRPGPTAAVTVDGRTVTPAELQFSIDRAPTGRPRDLAGLGVLETLAAVFAAARDGTSVLLRAPDSTAAPPPELPTDTLLAVVTSGTSGRPRLVARTAGSWSASFRPFTDLTGLTSADTVLLTGPLHSTLHLFAAVHALWLGARLTDDRAAATAAHLVPTVLADLLADPPPRLRTVVVAGASLPARLVVRAAELGLRLVEYYGAAELSFVAARVAPAQLRPFPGVQIRIVDGVLWARSPYLAIGRSGLDRTGTAGGGRLETLRSPDGFASVGDLAALDDAGNLTIRGRGDAAVTTAGHTVLVEDVETVISALPGVRAVAVVGTPHPRLGEILTAVVELGGGAELAAVRAAARKLLGGPAFPRRWAAATSLPRTPGGKIARAQVLARLDDERGSRPEPPAGQ